MKNLAKILIIAVCSLVLFASSAAALVETKNQNSATTSTSLIGTWVNELGSKLIIEDEKEATITGSYETAVSLGGCAKGSYTLVGRTNRLQTTQMPTVGFVVSWKNDQSNCNSVTAWSGQLQKVNDKDQLVTTWLLTLKTKPEQNWMSTYVNKDTFTKKVAE